MPQEMTLPTTTSDNETTGLVYHSAFSRILTIIQADEYPYLVGPAASGKTTIGEQIAKKLGLQFYYSGAVESAFQLKGFIDAHGRMNKTAFVHAYEKGGVFLQDEMDASDSTALVALNAAIGNRLLDLPDGTILPMHPDFKLIAAANTSGRGATLKYTGRNQLDSATLDRYTQVMVDYDPDLEKHIAMKLNGEDGLAMLSLVHQARAAAHALHLDENFEFSTRALVKGIKFMKQGMSLEDAFMQGTMDKIGEDNATKVLAKINMNVRNFVQTTARHLGDDTLRQLTDLTSRLAEFDKARAELTRLEEDTARSCKQAFSLAGQLAAEIQRGADAQEGLLRAHALLKGLTEAAPQVVDAVTKAMAGIQNAANGP